MPVTRAYLDEAFRQIISEDYDPKRESKLWDVADPSSGRLFPPKVILNRAAELAGLTNKGENFRGGGWPTNDILEQFGFVVVPKNSKAALLAERELQDLNIDALKKLAQDKSQKNPKIINRMNTYISRSPVVSAYAKKMAAGKCDLCRKDAPFSTNLGPFLECHHLVFLSEGGSDAIENVVALCPNCHRQMHFADDASLVRKLKVRVDFRDRAVGSSSS